MKPVVAIVGRVNVGKSTLFNRLLGEPVAITEDLPGTTRDRIFGDTLMKEHEITLVDTGGLEIKPTSSLGEKVKAQVKEAIAEADVIIFVVDGQGGVISTDWEITRLLRNSGKLTVLAVNKTDNPRLEGQITDFYQLGIGTPIAVSAYHGRGINELTDAVASLLPPPTLMPPEPDRPKLAIVGRPNVGKSTLLNAILGEERAIVDRVPGTTRDAIDSVFYYNSQEIVLIDTAGIRRRGHIATGIEYYGVFRALRAIERCDVAILVIDAAELIAAQDLHIAGYIKEAFKGVVLVVNKWDLVPEEKKDEYIRHIEQRFKFMPYAPIFNISAILRQGMDRLLPQALLVWQERRKRLSQAAINEFIKEAAINRILPKAGPKSLKVYGAYQSKTSPPTLIFSVNEPRLVHFSYQRFLENKLRQAFSFQGTSIRLIFKKVSGKRIKEAG